MALPIRPRSRVAEFLDRGDGGLALDRRRKMESMHVPQPLSSKKLRKTRELTMLLVLLANRSSGRIQKSR